VIDFLFVIIEHFRYILRLKSVDVSVFQRGVGHFEHRLQRERGVADQLLLVSAN